MSLEVILVPLLRDNYACLLRDTATGKLAIIDPGEALPVVRKIDAHGGKLDLILNTHHHGDHAGGNQALSQRYGAKVYCGVKDKGRLSHVDVELADGDQVQLGETVCRVIHAPGHTHGHVLYWFWQEKLLFVGDVLFSLSCGNVFEGTDAQMCQSLSRIHELPDDTMVYCGHEYTHMFVGFALSLDPTNPALQEKQRKVAELHARGQPTVPMLLGEEKRLNPYLRIFDPAFAKVLGSQDASPLALFLHVSRLDKY